MDVHRGFWWGNMRDRDHLEDTGVNGSIILKWVFHKYDEGSVDCINLSHDRDNYRALVNAVMSLRVA
jgi:hypothetical protein